MRSAAWISATRLNDQVKQPHAQKKKIKKKGFVKVGLRVAISGPCVAVRQDAQEPSARDVSLLCRPFFCGLRGFTCALDAVQRGRRSTCWHVVAKGEARNAALMLPPKNAKKSASRGRRDEAVSVTLSAARK